VVRVSRAEAWIAVRTSIAPATLRSDAVDTASTALGEAAVTTSTGTVT